MKDNKFVIIMVIIGAVCAVWYWQKDCCHCSKHKAAHHHSAQIHHAKK